MGRGFIGECPDCDFKIFANYGAGFLYPQVYSDTIENIKNGELGEEIKAFFEEHGDAAIDAGSTVLLCEECGNIEVGDDLTVYLPVEGKMKDEERGRWSVAFPAEGYKFVTPWDLREKGQYKKIMEYSHKCSKCQGNMKIISEKEFKKLKCPKCHKKLKVDGDVLWD